MLERVKGKFGKKQGIPPKYKFVVRMGRHRAYETNLFEMLSKWEKEWHPSQYHGLGSDNDYEGVEALDGPQFDQEYLRWWAGARPDPLGLYGLEKLIQEAKGEVNEEEEEEREDEEQDVHMEDAPQQEKKGVWDVPISITIIETQQHLEIELSECATLYTYKLVLTKIIYIYN